MLLPLSCSVAATREFFAMINSLTKFIRTSSFSISTRTVRFTTGLETVFFSGVACAPAFFSAGSSTFFTSCEGFVSSSGISITAPVTFSISDTFCAALITVSKSCSEITTRVKSRSNFSSSTSCADGTETTISPFSSIALNTRNALAALSRQLS